MKHAKLAIGIVVTSLLAGQGDALAQVPVGTAFTYQGQLKDGGSPADGDYDFLFRLFDGPDAASSQIGGDLMIEPASVSDGLFMVELDFGSSAFAADARWLEVAVRPLGARVDYTVLSPRQPLTATPFALQVRGLQITDSGGLEVSGDIHTSGEVAASAYSSNSDLIFKVNPGNVECARFDDATCNFGIGTMIPAFPLHVIGDGSDNAIRASGTLSVTKDLNQPGTGLSVTRRTANLPFPVSVSTQVDGNKIDAFGGLLGGDANLNLNNDSSGNVLLANGGGNVGIGTTDPEYALHVVSAGEHPFLERAIFGQNTATLGIGVGGWFESASCEGAAVLGSATAASGANVGVAGRSFSPTGRGVSGAALATSGINIGVRGFTLSPDGYGVFSSGACHVEGTLSKSGGSFKIDHPLDPENKYLQHSFVESPDMMNVYNGNVILDENGKAFVRLPDYFDGLNRDFRYQLTPMGAAMPNLHIGEEIANNSFRIAGGQAGMKVSWQVTGIRQDPWAEAHRIEVEPSKRPEHQGKYLDPELYGRPKEMAVHYFPDAERPVTETALPKAQAGQTPTPSTGEMK